MQPTREVKDAILANVSPGLGRNAVDGVKWAAIEATERTAKNRHHLLDFDEWNEVSL